VLQHTPQQLQQLQAAARDFGLGEADAFTAGAFAAGAFGAAGSGGTAAVTGGGAFVGAQDDADPASAVTDGRLQLVVLANAHRQAVRELFNTQEQLRRSEAAAQMQAAIEAKLGAEKQAVVRQNLQLSRFVLGLLKHAFPRASTKLRSFHVGHVREQMERQHAESDRAEAEAGAEAARAVAGEEGSARKAAVPVQSGAGGSLATASGPVADATVGAAPGAAGSCVIIGERTLEQKRQDLRNCFPADFSPPWGPWLQATGPRRSRDSVTAGDIAGAAAEAEAATQWVADACDPVPLQEAECQADEGDIDRELRRHLRRVERETVLVQQEAAMRKEGGDRMQLVVLQKLALHDPVSEVTGKWGEGHFVPPGGWVGKLHLLFQHYRTRERERDRVAATAAAPEGTHMAAIQAAAAAGRRASQQGRALAAHEAAAVEAAAVLASTQKPLTPQQRQMVSQKTLVQLLQDLGVLGMLLSEDEAIAALQTTVRRGQTEALNSAMQAQIAMIAADVDGDGNVTREEFQNWFSAQQEQEERTRRRESGGCGMPSAADGAEGGGGEQEEGGQGQQVEGGKKDKLLRIRFEQFPVFLAHCAISGYTPFAAHGKVLPGDRQPGTLCQSDSAGSVVSTAPSSRPGSPGAGDELDTLHFRRLPHQQVQSMLQHMDQYDEYEVMSSAPGQARTRPRSDRRRPVGWAAVSGQTREGSSKTLAVAAAAAAVTSAEAAAAMSAHFPGGARASAGSMMPPVSVPAAGFGSPVASRQRPASARDGHSAPGRPPAKPPRGAQRPASAAPRTPGGGGARGGTPGRPASAHSRIQRSPLERRAIGEAPSAATPGSASGSAAAAVTVPVTVPRGSIGRGAAGGVGAKERKPMSARLSARRGCGCGGGSGGGMNEADSAAAPAAANSARVLSDRQRAAFQREQLAAAMVSVGAASTGEAARAVEAGLGGHVEFLQLMFNEYAKSNNALHGKRTFAEISAQTADGLSQGMFFRFGREYGLLPDIVSKSDVTKLLSGRVKVAGASFAGKRLLSFGDHVLLLAAIARLARARLALAVGPTGSLPRQESALGHGFALIQAAERAVVVAAAAAAGQMAPHSSHVVVRRALVAGLLVAPAAGTAGVGLQGQGASGGVQGGRGAGGAGSRPAAATAAAASTDPEQEQQQARLRAQLHRLMGPRQLALLHASVMLQEVPPRVSTPGAGGGGLAGRGGGSRNRGAGSGGGGGGVDTHLDLEELLRLSGVARAKALAEEPLEWPAADGAAQQKGALAGAGAGGDNPKEIERSVRVLMSFLADGGQGGDGPLDDLALSLSAGAGAGAGAASAQALVLPDASWGGAGFNETDDDGIHNISADDY
jgi:hypothetical protein